MRTIPLPTNESVRSILKEEILPFEKRLAQIEDHLIKLRNPDHLVDKVEVQKILGDVSLSHVDNLRRRGILKSYRVGNLVRFKYSEVLGAAKAIGNPTNSNS